MSKKLRIVLITLCAALGISSLVACKAEQVYNEPIPETELAETYVGETVDVDGNLLVPFDVAYAEAFETGAYKYNEGQILLKMAKSYNGKRTNNLRKCGIASLAKFSETPNGNWWTAKLNGDFDAITAVKKARSLEEVLIADFDYIYETQSVEVEGDTTGILSDVCGNQKVGNQHHLKQCSIQEAWKFLQKEGISAGGLSSVVVAVIDTGVDYTHPDLKANMWVNKNEIPNNGIDDDKNGYIDDIHGIDTIANKGDPMDDHGHGTHVAGIIGASNNKEGVVGIAYNAKIMAVKAGQASGVFNQSDIAEAILYAYEMGADVINMSFGGSACSIAVQDALATAYTTASLVAAAGNDGSPNVDLPNYPAAFSYVIGVMSVNDVGTESVFTNYDYTAYNSVEYEVYAPGENIMSTLPGGRYGKLSGTSMAAPVVSGAAALLRSYFTDRDMYPSKFIMAQICATSEETAGCIHKVPHNIPMILDIYKAFTKMPKPDVTLYDYYLFDTESIAEGNSGDGVIDAGETIEIGAILRNRWGMSKNTIVTIDDESSLGVDNPYVEILTSTVNFDSVGTYSTKDTLLREGNVIIGTESPLVVKIADNCPNDYLISLTITITAENALDEKDDAMYTTKGAVSFWVRNGVVLPSQFTKDTTLTKDNYYILPNSTYIHEGVTVTVEPGTQIQFYTDDPHDPYATSYIPCLNVAGRFITHGTEEEPVKIFPSETMGEYAVSIQKQENGYVELNYTNVTNIYLNINKADHCFFDQVYPYQLLIKELQSNGNILYTQNFHAGVTAEQVTNSTFYKVGASRTDFYFNVEGNYDTCIFVDSAIANYNYNNESFVNCVFIGNSLVNDTSSRTYYYHSTMSLRRELVNLTFSQVVKNEETGISYLQCHAPTLSQVYAYDYRSLAKMLGGDLCCIETEEELAFLRDANLEGFVGLQKGSSTWSSGAIFESLSFIMGDYDRANIGWTAYYYPYGEENYLDFSYWPTSSLDKWILIEIPSNNGKATGNDLTEEQFNQIYNQWIELGYHNTGFYGNAILNNFNDTDTSHWLTIISDGSGNDYNISSIGIAGNYWGTIDKTMINRQITDFDDYQTLPDIIEGEILTVAPENTFPFVTDAFILDSNGERVQTVGNEKITVVVQFNRDMDTSVPLRVRFGSSEPYAEYEILGEYVTPREWRGEYVLKTTIENGNQYFRIENGQAADDSWLKLYETPGRFTFELDTTAAQAMLMQGEATDTGIQLTWIQDDFDTLLGYNVYRSDKEDGYYTRLNDYVLSQEETSFFDDTVEPGKVYYYNFTVVKTDLTESIPSGKIVIMSKDTMAPDIYHSPVRTAYTDSNLVVSATITDNLMIKSAKLYYRAVGATEWKSVTMSALNSKYTGIIGAENLSVDGLEYYIEAFDGISYTYKGTAENPYFVTVKLAVDSSSLGDVDGDGVITVKDAQMLLMGINDLYNLSEEEFLRADIDSSGELQAWEALRILDYISGKVTTIVV